MMRHPRSPLPLRPTLLTLIALLGCAASAQSPIKTRWAQGSWTYSSQAPIYSRQGDKVLVWDTTFQGLRVYRTSDGRILSQISLSSAAKLTGACFSANGSLVYFGTSRGRLYAYDVAKRTSTPFMDSGSGGSVTNLTISKDGSRLAFASASKLWAVNLSNPTNAPTQFDGPATTASLAFADNDTRLVTSGPTLYTLVPEHFGPLLTFPIGTKVKQGPDTAGPVFVSPDSNTIVSEDKVRNGSIITAYSATVSYLPGALTYSHLWSVNPATDNTIALSGFSSDGTKILFATNSAGYQWSVQPLNLLDGKLAGGSVASWSSTADPLVAPSPATNSLFVFAGSLGQTWSFSTATPTSNTLFDSVSVNPSDTKNIRPVFTDANVSGTPASVTDEFYIKPGSSTTLTTQRLVRNTQTGAVLGSFTIPHSGLAAGRMPAGCVLSPDGKYFAQIVTTPTQALAVYALDTGTLVSQCPITGTYSRAVWGGTGRIFLIGGSGYTVDFDGRTLTPRFSFGWDQNRGILSPNGSWYAINRGASVDVYNANNNVKIANIQSLGGSIGSLSFGGGFIGVQELSKAVVGPQNLFRVFTLPATSQATLTTLSLARSVAYSLDVALDGGKALTAGALSPDGEMIVLSHSATATDYQNDPLVHSSVRMYLVANGEAILPSQMDDQFAPNMDVTTLPNVPVFAFSLDKDNDSRTVKWTSGGATVAASTGPRLAVTTDKGSLGVGSVAQGTIAFSEAFDDNVNVQLTSGDAATVSPGSITVLAGKVSASFTVTAKSVSATTDVNIAAKAGARSGTAMLRVVVPALDGLSLSPTTIRPGETSTGTVTVTDPAPTGGVTITLSSSNAAATLPATVTIPVGSKSATFTVSSQPGLANLTVATVTASYNNVSRTGTLTINPLPVSLASFTVAGPSPLIGGDAISGKCQGTVTLSSAAPNGGALILLTTEQGSPLTLPINVTVPAGMTSVSFDIVAANVTTAKTWKASAWFGGLNKDVSIAVAPLALSPNLTITGSNPVFGGGPSVVTVTATLLAPLPTPTIVKFTSGLPNVASFVGANASVTIPANQTTATATVTTFAVTKDTPTPITASLDNGSKATGSLIVAPLELSRIVLDTSSVMGGSAGVTGKVYLTGSAPAKGITINLSASDTKSVSFKSASIKVAAGLMTADFVLLPKVIPTTKTVTIIATWKGYNAVQTTIEIKAPVLTELTIPTSISSTAKGVTGTVTLSEAPAADVTITLTSSNAKALKVVNVKVKKGAKTATFALSPQKVQAATTVTVTATLGNSIQKQITVTP